MFNQHKINIVTWNAHALRHKTSEFYHFLTANDVHIALVTETWLDLSTHVSNRNYIIYRNDRVKNRGGGVALYIDRRISHKLIPPITTHLIENVGVHIELDNKKINLFAIYFPGNTANCLKNDCQSKDPNHLKNMYKSDLTKLASIRGNFILGGDLNSRNRLWNCNRANTWGNLLEQSIINNRLKILVPNEPTFIPPNFKQKPSTLDIFLTNCPSITTIPTVLHELSSDHLPVILSLPVKSSFSECYVLDYAKTNWHEYKKLLKSDKHSITAIPLSTSAYTIDNLIEDLQQKITLAIEKAVPKRRVRLGTPILPLHIINLMKLRNVTIRQWIRTRNVVYKHNLSQLNFNIKQQLNIFRNMAWNKKLSDFTKASKPFWKATKLIKNKNIPIPSLQGVYGKIIHSNYEKANLLKQTFETKHNLTSHFSDSQTNSAVSESITHIQNSIVPINERLKVTSTDVSYFIKTLKPNKSPGPDNLPNTCIKKLPKNIILYLTFIYNCCLYIGYFPNSWKVAKILPIPKPSKSPTVPDNYRPISLLNSFSKILEQLIKQKIMTFLENSSIIPDFQFGFRPNHSCLHPLLRITNHVKNSIKEKKSVGMVVLDIQAAFDSVWHDALIHKLLQYNFPLSIIKIIQSFLCARLFHVHINNVKSTVGRVSAGVPQGSVLGPILYNIYTSDMPRLPNCYLSMFADDTSIYTSSSNPYTIQKNLQSALDTLTKYLFKWKIMINSAKTNAIFFSRKRKLIFLPSTKLKLNNDLIPWVDTVKFLGIHLDKKLNFGLHVSKTTDKADILIKILYPLINRKSLLSKDNKLLIYKAVFQPMLLYGCPIWKNSAKHNINKLQIKQNKILKMILNLPHYFPTHELHNKAKIEPVDEQINKFSINFYDKLELSNNNIIKNLQHVPN